MIPVLVCGSNYGRYYVSAVRRAPERYRLAGILSRGSERSQALASRFDCPHFFGAEEIPDDVSLACFAAGSGAESVLIELLDREVNVLCEHPIGVGQVTTALRAAEPGGVRMHVNAHFPQLPAVRSFIESCSLLWEEAPPLTIEGLASDRALYAVAAILAETGPAGALHWSFHDSRPGAVFALLAGSVTDVPISLGIQRTGGEGAAELEDTNPRIAVDFRLTAVFPTGILSLLSPAGPVIWTANGNQVVGADSELWSLQGGPTPVTARQFLEMRAQANLSSIDAVVGAIETGVEPTEQRPGHLLAVSRLWEALAGLS